MSLKGYDLLGLLTLQKSMVLEFVEDDDHFSLVHKNELQNLQSEILKLNNQGYVDRRVSDRRPKSTEVDLERRTFASRVLNGNFKCN